jgi:uncharacterized membrane protein YdcZ (DUF606 family)
VETLSDRRAGQMTSQQNPSNIIISYDTLRKIIGLLGISMPFTTSLGAYMISGTGIQKSISDYYYTSAGNVLVGTLFAIGVFLWSYKGYESFRNSSYKYIDNWAGNLCCVFAITCALFPTAPDDPAPLARRIGYVHTVSAFLFFVVLFCFSFFLFTQSDQPVPTERKKSRNRVYRVCGGVMGSCVLLGAIYVLLPHYLASKLEWYRPIFWMEAIAIEAFGISWLTKGEAVLQDRESNEP